MGKFKLRASAKIFIGFVVISAGLYYGYRIVTDRIVFVRAYPEIKPGKVTLFGVDAGSGYRIIVANQAAQLVQGGKQDLDVGDIERVDEGQTAKKIPLKQMMEILQGNQKNLGRFIMNLNNIKEGGPNWPTDAPEWDAETIERAINGDAQLQRKLESDLNTKLDGTPLESISLSSLLNGIIIRLPVPVKVMVAGEQKTLVGRILEPYRTSFTIDVEDRFKEKNATDAMIRGYYKEEAMKLLANPSQKENVRNSLRARIDKSRAEEYRKAPELILSKARIILNEDLIERADYEEYDSSDGSKLYKINLQLTDEGRFRLWRYSKILREDRYRIWEFFKWKDRGQLLFVVNGTAIAAPWVEHELSSRTVTITRLQDQELVKEAVETINNKAKAN